MTRLFKEEVAEAEPIVVAVVNALLEWAPGRGRDGAELRAKGGILKVNVAHLLHDNELGPAIAEMFRLAIVGGITLAQVENIRRSIAHFEPVTVGAIVIKHCMVQLILVAGATIISGMEFRSRQDVEDVQEMINDAFNEVAEQVADRMDAMTYRAIVALHAAVTFHLIETARPRPRMMTYRFNQPMTTLTIAYRLYADASRGDELRYENAIVHPLFSPLAGRALSA